MKKAVVFLVAIFAATAMAQSEKWANYNVGEVRFVSQSPDSEGAKIYAQIVPNPDEYIAAAARRVLDMLYFSPEDSIVKVNVIDYRLRDYDGISAKSGGGGRVRIDYSTRWVEKVYNKNQSAAEVERETLGVLLHELCHAYQLEPQGIGNYGNSKEFRAMIEGTADCLRFMGGSFTMADRPRGGTYMDGYRTTGFFLAWLNETKRSDFLKRFNASALTVVPWSFSGGVNYALGGEYELEKLWNEYLDTTNNR